MKEMARKLWEKLKSSKKAHKAGVHAAMFVAMSLGVYLAHGMLPLVGGEMARLVGAMVIGAYCHKPAADFACRKLLDE